MLAGENHPLDYIIATKWGQHFRGPPPKPVEGKDESAIRDFLESNGNISTSLACRFLTLFTGVAPEEYRWEARFDVDIDLLA